MDFPIGIYVAITNVNIRKEPRVVDNILGTNKIGAITAGTRREVFETLTNNDNSTWGRISDFDSAGKALWICIHGLNREYLRYVEPNKMTVEDRLTRLENWARTKGYS